MPELHTLFERLRAAPREQATRPDLMKQRAALSGPASSPEGTAWCDVILATGSSIVNDTLPDFLDSGKRAIFWEVTIAAAAEILGLERNGECGH